MAGSTFGRLFQVTTWGESHGKGIGVVVDGCPAGLPLTEEDIQIYLDRRKPGQSQFTTKRNEADQVEILSGVFNIPIATGTISNMVKRCAYCLTDTVSKIKQKMTGSGLGNVDETGTRVDKKLWWVHDASNCEYTYLYISPKRGFEGMEQCGVLCPSSP